MKHSNRVCIKRKDQSMRATRTQAHSGSGDAKNSGVTVCDAVSLGEWLPTFHLQGSSPFGLFS